MLISQKVVDAINEQIGNEFAASLQYVSIAAYFAGESLDVLSSHFFRQAEEERDHAMRFIKYLLETGAHVHIPTVNSPQSRFSSAQEAVKLSLDQEIKVTQQINSMVHLATTESDYITLNFLQWFLKEQLEEVSSMENLLKVIQRAGSSGLLHVEEYIIRSKGKVKSHEDEEEDES